MDNFIIIQLQNYFPHLLKHIIISAEELFEIHIASLQYIKKLDCSNNAKINDELIMNLHNLVELKCYGCNDN